ncbi:MAG TPA: hypothetical protein VI855_08060, partial [Dehalococcoidia bacterium]|nr:hypothetical protein [Dehalococcoidia bacterium]
MRSTNGGGAVYPGSRATPEAQGPAQEPCPHCHGAGWVSKHVPVGHPDFGQAFPCRCQGADDPAARTAALRRYSNLGALARITLEDTNPQGLLDDATSQRLFSQALAAAREFAENPT